MAEPKLFLDSDGVLADFDAGVRRLVYLGGLGAVWLIKRMKR